MPANRQGAGAGSTRLSLNPKWPLWIPAPERVAPAVVADVVESTETASLISGGLLAGTDVYEAAETGSLTAGALLAGASQKTSAGKFGSLTAGGLLSGTDVFTATET